MKQRKLSWLMLVCGWLCLTTSAHAEVVEGRDYQVLSPTQPTSNPAKIVVTEFFSYYCSHCFVFYPTVTAWAAKLPKDVMFERVPVTLGRDAWKPLAQAFYALQTMGKDGQYDQAIFSGVHMQNAGLATEDSVVSFLAKQGVNADQLTQAWHSFGVEMSTRRADQLMKNYRVQGTPTLVVNGKYVVINEGTHDYNDLLARVDQVIAKARAERSKK